MAKIEETIYLVKLSRLVKDNNSKSAMILDDLPSTIEQVVQELVTSDIVVEVEKA